VNTVHNFDFTIPDLDLTSLAYFRAYVAAKSVNKSNFYFYNGSSQIMSASIRGFPALPKLMPGPISEAIGSRRLLPTSISGLNMIKNRPAKSAG